MLPVEQPFKTYTGLDGKPLENGFVYFGLPNQNPITSPVTVYWDAAGTIPAAQPLRTVGGYIMRAGTPANVFFDGAYSELVQDSKKRQVFYARTSDEFSIVSAVTKFIAALAGSAGSFLLGFIQAGVGAVKRTVQDKLRENVDIEDFLSPELLADALTGAPVLDHTAAVQRAINAAAGKELRGNANHTYRFTGTLIFPSNSSLDFRGASILDDVRGYWPASDAGRAEPLFFIYGVENVTIRNATYRATPMRSTVSNEIPTAIFWIGDNRGGAEPTRNISISQISGSNFVASTVFVSVTGNAFDIDVKRIQLTGPCTYGINIEYGQAPSSEDRYGLHPYNVSVDQFNGYDNPISVAFLRVASCYNVKFSNCFGKNVRSFIYAWTGDRSISRVSENVTFENCTHYAGPDFLPGAINYVVQVLGVNKDGSTGDDLPDWTNYDHLFTFLGCQLQNNKTVDSACVRYYGTLGKVIFDTCILQGSYFGIRAEPALNVTYTSITALTIRNTVFKNNTRDLNFRDVRGVLVEHCTFKDPDSNAIPIKLESGAYYNKFLNNEFSGLVTNIAWVVIDAGADDNEFTGNMFADSASPGSAPPLELSSRTRGRDNVFSDQGLTRQGWAYYGVTGEPSTMAFNLTDLPDVFVDSKKRKTYIAQTGGVIKTINYIRNGEVGDEVIFQTVSVGASVTLKDNDLSGGTTSRMLTKGGGDLVLTGSRRTVRAVCTELGWLLDS